jgi:tetratricopeptide (TPR) repeat protein
MPVLRALLARRPLSASYWDALLEATSDEPESARAVCAQAIALGVRPGDFLRNRAAASLSLARESGGRVDRADLIADLRGAFLFGQKEGLLHVLAGDLALQAGASRTAIEAYETAAAIDPGLPEAWAGLGEVRHAQRRFEESLHAFETAVSLRPADPWIRNNLGVVLRDSGRLPEARAAFEEAHRLSPGLFEPLYNLGLTAERMGRVQDARRWYGEARRLRPGFPPLEDAWRRLSQ